MSDPRLTRVQAAMTALRPARCVTMARIDEFLARNKVAEAINEADGMRQREPFVHLVNELVDALRALDESQSAKSCPLISDATLAKIVRAMYSADTDAAAEADVFDSIDRDVILEAVVNDKHAEALENARGCLAHRTDGASVIAALEEANEEAARNNAADDLLDPTKTSEADVDAGLRAMGIDPVALGERGLASVRREQLRKAIRDYLNAPLQPANSVMREAAESFFGEDFDR